MKKNINRIFSLLMAITLFSSCLNDDSLVLDPSEGHNVIEFGNVSVPVSTSSDPYTVFTPLTVDNETKSFEAVINYAGPDRYAPKDIVVSLALANDIIAEYNAAASTSYVALDPAAFEIPSSVTIKKGESEVRFKITLDPTKFDLTKSNVIAMQITSASSGIVSGNFGKVIYNLPVKSVWEGVYTVTVTNVTGVDGNIPPVATWEDVELSTIGPNRLQTLYAAQIYGGYTQYQFNSDNTDIVEILVFSGGNLGAQIVSVGVIDPVNGIFEITSTWLGRTVKERYVKQPE